MYRPLVSVSLYTFELTIFFLKCYDWCARGSQYYSMSFLAKRYPLCYTDGFFLNYLNHSVKHNSAQIKCNKIFVQQARSVRLSKNFRRVLYGKRNESLLELEIAVRSFLRFMFRKLPLVFP